MIVTASVLNVRSGPGTEFRVLNQLQKGARVSVQERHGAWAWAYPISGWVHRDYLVPSAPAGSLLPPQGLKGIERTFGPAGSNLASAGRVQLLAPLYMGWQPGVTVREFACHVLMVDIFTTVFEEIFYAGLWDRLKTYDGCYNDRYKTGQEGAKSTHAWGIAVDLNAATNRYGTRGDMPPEIIEIFEMHGFLHLKRDPMHFQYARGY